MIKIRKRRFGLDINGNVDSTYPACVLSWIQISRDGSQSPDAHPNIGNICSQQFPSDDLPSGLE